MGCLQAGLPQARKTPGWFFVVKRIREEMTEILSGAPENSSAWGFRGSGSDQGGVGGERELRVQQEGSLEI